MLYFDYAASCLPRQKIYEEYFRKSLDYYINPHGTNIFSEKARLLIKDAEIKLFHSLEISPYEASVIWCSGATEALNLAIFSLANNPKITQAVYDPTAHPAMLEPLLKAGKENKLQLQRLKVDKTGKLLLPEKDIDQIELFCACHVNNETGQKHNLSELRKLFSNRCIFCIDAAQSLGKAFLPWKFAKIDLMALSARKIGAPPSVGALIVRKRVKLQPQILGGGQQNNLRSGTLNPAAIAAFADCVELVCNEQEEYMKKNWLLNRILREKIPEISAGKWQILSDEFSVSDILLLSIPGCEGAVLARMLAEEANIILSPGSACAAESKKVSHVLKAMGLPAKIARSTIRISIGHKTTYQDINKLLNILPKIVEKF